ncbi:MAG: sulfatase [Thermoproteota archaeon]
MNNKEGIYNFIVIVSDTFRYDLLNNHFMVRPNVHCKTSHLNRLSDDSVIFHRAYHASFPTVPNRADLLTGRFTYTYYDWSPLPKDEITLPTILSRKGYVTMLIADTPHILKDGYNFDRGFNAWVWIRGQENDRYRTDPERIDLPCSSEKLRDVETTVQHIRNNYYRFCEEDWITAKTAKEAIRWLERNHRRRFFLYIDFFDPHEPWDPPEYYVERYDPGYVCEKVIYPLYGPSDFFEKEELTHMKAMYAAEASLVDRWIGEIIEKIEDLGLYENTITIFTSDHGFYFGEHGLVGKSIICGEYHGLVPLYEEVCHIPLLIRPADMFAEAKKGERWKCLVQTPDITATVAELAGIDEPRIQGMSLVNIMKGEDSGDFRRIAVSTPSLIRGVEAGLRATITSEDWSLVLAPQVDLTQLEEKTHTLIVDGKQRTMKPFGKIRTELYNIARDPKQQHDLFKENIEKVKELHDIFIKNLKILGAKEDIILQWLKYKGI